ELRNPAVMLGYWGMPDETARVIRPDGWLRTGDLVAENPDGTYTFVGREKEIIRRRGENISAFEVEQVIETHPGVVACAVVGVESELGEEEVAAFVVLHDESVEELEIIRFSSSNMAYYMVPRFIKFVSALPQTESFKVKKYELVEQAVAERAALWDRDAAGIRVDRAGMHSS
ncbi:MAG: AMP-binding protein, partial [Gemmatimonas sp.]|nr:AMP-binding protein [Gemmatimonas sp.]